MAGALVGAFALLASSTLLSWPVRGGGGLGFSHAASTAVFNAAPGTCLTWSKPDGSDMAAVNCADRHLFEVSAAVDIAARYPQGAAFPDPAAWPQLTQQTCTEPTRKYLGGRLDPFGRFGVGALKPSEDQWRRGVRTLHCGLQNAAPSGRLLFTTGRVAEGDQSDVHEPGSCLGIVNKGVGDPVNCAQPHSFEIVGVIDLGTQFPNGFPPEGKQDEALAGLCGKLAADYSGHADLGARNLIVAWDNRRQESWNAGSHRTDCKVGQKLPDNSGLAPVTGSIRAKAPLQAAPPQEAPQGAPQEQQPPRQGG
ncbi:septum formation family protein [Gandjariella thermophila]|nr:septum formation family protein [Gandjariella thermophila]